MRKTAFRVLIFGLVVGLLYVAALPVHCEDLPASVRAEMGYGVSLSDESAVVPVAVVGVEGPLPIASSSLLRIMARLGFNGSPGATVAFGDVKTFQGGEFEGGIGLQVGHVGATRTFLFVKGGATARRDSANVAPAERFPTHYLLGAEVRHAGKAPWVLSAAYGNDQVCLTGSNAPKQIVTEGRVRIKLPKIAMDKAGMNVSADAHVDLSGLGRSVFRVQTTVVVGG